MATETFPDVAPSRGSGLSSELRVLDASFGDAYEQRAADGLNALAHTYEAVFDVRPVADIDTIVAFLARHAGVTGFWFTPPGGVRRKWRCRRWTGPTWVSATHRSLRASFTEDFTP